MARTEATTEDLVRRAREGEEAAFTRLLEQNRARLRSVVRRMVGHAEDTDDIVQESSFRAWQSLGQFKGDSQFGTWLCAIGVRQSIDHLRRKKRWRGRAQVVYQHACYENPELAGEVVSTLSDPEFQFSVAEHIAYCFTCVGRSLPPEEQGALVLREVVGLGNREAAREMEVSESVLRHRLASARRTMEDEFEGLCSLVNQKGVCYQCRGLRNGTPESRQGPEPPELSSLDQRIAIARDANIDSGVSQLLHDLFWHRTEELEEAELGTPDPSTDCGREEGA